MWVIGLLFCALFFLGGRESIDHSVKANETTIEVHEVRIDRIEKDATELKQEIKEELKEQRIMIQDIHKIIMNE